MRIVLLILLLPALAAAEPQHVQIGNATLTATFGDASQGESLDDLTLALDRDGASVWKLRGWKQIARGAAVPEMLAATCETYAVDVQKQMLGKRAGARVDIACRNGEDMFTANAIAILIDTLDPYAVLWLGEGDSVSNENDACVTDQQVTFTLSGKKLTQRIVEVSWKNRDGSCDPSGKPGKKHTKKSTRVIDL
jgi:hypothetical protein